MSSIEPVNSKALSNPRMYEKVAAAMNVWSNTFFRLTLPSNLGTKASIKQIQNEDAKVFSMGNYIGRRIAQQDAIPYDGCTYEGEPICDKTKNTLWGYPVRFPDGFKQSNGEKFSISLGITFKCHVCRGTGRVTCRNCGGKVRWEERRGDKIVNYTCNCGDGKQNCDTCIGYGQMQKILRVQTSYQFQEKKVKSYSGRVPENLLLNAPGNSLFKYISDFEDTVLTEAGNGLESDKFEQLIQDLCLIIKHEFDAKVASRLINPNIFNNFIDDYFERLPNLAVANKRLEQESIPVRMKCEVISVPKLLSI